MRVSFIAIAALLAGCAEQTLFPSQTVTRAPVVCEPDAVLNEGRQARRYPANCPNTPELVDRYSLGFRIASLEDEVRDVNYLIASRDSRGLIGSIGFRGRSFRGFGATGSLIGYRADLKDELRFLKREAGLED